MPIRPASGFRRAVHPAAVIHPLPSLLNSVLVAALTLVAGAPPLSAAWLALAMLGFQASIGATNDLVDAPHDRLTKPQKPIPAGAITPRAARTVAIVGGSAGLAISAGFGLPTLVLGVAGYGTGLAYDLVLRQRGLGWLAFAAAFPILLTWTWTAAAGVLPPGWPMLLPLAALAGPAIHLANGVVDLEADEASGATSLARSLGRQRALLLMTALTATVYLLAWGLLLALGDRALPTTAVAASATMVAGVGVWCGWQEQPRTRELGWLLQAAALTLLAVAWTAAVIA